MIYINSSTKRIPFTVDVLRSNLYCIHSFVPPPSIPIETSIGSMTERWHASMPRSHDLPNLRISDLVHAPGQGFNPERFSIQRKNRMKKPIVSSIDGFEPRDFCPIDKETPYMRETGSVNSLCTIPAPYALPGFSSVSMCHTT